MSPVTPKSIRLSVAEIIEDSRKPGFDKKKLKKNMESQDQQY